MKSDTVHIGVDVSKLKLDIYVPARREGARPTTREVGNNIDGFKELRDLARKAEATVCVEPTGGYELELIAFMRKSGVPVAYTDALRVRQFAKAEGNLAKNDRIDAALISRFAVKVSGFVKSPRPVFDLAAVQEEAHALGGRIRAARRNQLDRVGPDDPDSPIRVLAELDILNAFDHIRSCYVNIAETVTGRKL